MTFDEVRAAYPNLGFALYAMEPGVVTFEIIDPSGETFTFKDTSAEAAIAQAFPPAPAETCFD